NHSLQLQHGQCPRNGSYRQSAGSLYVVYVGRLGSQHFEECGFGGVSRRDFAKGHLMRGHREVQLFEYIGSLRDEFGLALLDQLVCTAMCRRIDAAGDGEDLPVLVKSYPSSY